jgi:predicted RNase H-like nuclease (RuvC/YqgF family)
MKRKIIIVTLISFLSLAFLFACSNEKKEEESKTKTTYGDVKKDTKQAMNTVKDYTQQKKEEYLQKMNAELGELEKKINELQNKVESKTSSLKEESKAKFSQSMAALNKEKQAAAKKLEELKSASGKSWNDIKSGVDSTMDRLSKTYEKVRSNFEK